MNQRNHVIVTLNDSDDDSDRSSTCQSETSDTVNQSNAGASTSALLRGQQKGDSSSNSAVSPSKQRTRTRHRRKRKRKSKTTPVHDASSRRNSKKDPAAGLASCKTQSDSILKSTHFVNVQSKPTLENGTVPHSDREGNHQGGASVRNMTNGTTVVTRIHSAPAVISRRMHARKEYLAMKCSGATDVSELKPGSGTVPKQANHHTTITDLANNDSSKAKPTSESNSSTATNGTAAQNSLSHLERQKSVLNSLKNTIQRSLPPVTLHTQSLTFQTNKTKQSAQAQPQKHSTTPAGAQPPSHVHMTSHSGNNQMSKAFLRYAQPLSSGVLHSSKIQPADFRRVLCSNGSVRNVPVSNLGARSLDPSHFRAQTQTVKTEKYRSTFQQMENSTVNAQVQKASIQNDDVSSSGSEKQQSSSKVRNRPKSILRREKSNIECGRKSVRFNHNDQINHI